MHNNIEKKKLLHLKNSKSQNMNTKYKRNTIYYRVPDISSFYTSIIKCNISNN